MAQARPHILILGAGINGCALARELALNGVSVTIVDQADISFGATAYSSRLIHGGLRYLEYGEFDLVRESLAERTRLLRLAPQFVRPLELFIPLDNRWGGLFSAAGKFLGWSRFSAGGNEKRRGAWLVKAGLWFYDTYARDPTLPHRKTHKVGAPGAVQVDPHQFRWLLSYYDAQVRFPERFTLALLADARRLAADSGAELNVFTYHHAQLRDGRVTIHPESEHASRNGAPSGLEFKPAAIVNATGAWVDLTLEQLRVPSPRLMAGTKGSHFITFAPKLREMLGGKGIYAEAADGRPVFILPFGPGALVGTTDEPYHGDPADAVASDAELDYLVATVNEIVPQAGITRADIAQHYSGVRPLPKVDASTPGAVTRRHWMQEIPGPVVPCYAIIGGKLTTCRSLAEECATTLLARVGVTKRADSRERPLPGGENYPPDDVDFRMLIEHIGMRFGLSEDQVLAMWALRGSEVERMLAGRASFSVESLPGTNLPLDFARLLIADEWVATLDDLIERRLMLVFEPALSVACLRKLAELLVEAGKLSPAEVESALSRTTARLARHFGKSLIPAESDSQAQASSSAN